MTFILSIDNYGGIMDLKKKFGQRIRELRKKRKISQEEFSERVNINQNTLSYIETGKNFCTADTLEKIIIALKIEPYELFNFEHLQKNDQLISAINTMLKDNPDKVQEIYRIVKAVVN